MPADSIVKVHYIKAVHPNGICKYRWMTNNHFQNDLLVLERLYLLIFFQNRLQVITKASETNHCRIVRDRPAKGVYL